MPRSMEYLKLINDIDVFVRRILNALDCGKGCTGIDLNSDHPSETTNVIVTEIRALRNAVDGG